MASATDTPTSFAHANHLSSTSILCWTLSTCLRRSSRCRLPQRPPLLLQLRPLGDRPPLWLHPTTDPFIPLQPVHLLHGLHHAHFRTHATLPRMVNTDPAGNAAIATPSITSRCPCPSTQERHAASRTPSSSAPGLSRLTTEIGSLSRQTRSSSATAPE